MKNEGMILFTSHSIFLTAIITNELDSLDSKPIGTLNSDDFALSIQDARSFKKDYCTTSNCKIYIIVNHGGLESTRFSISFIMDDQPIQLKEGYQIFVPSHKNLFFVSHPKKSSKTLSFNY